MDLTMTKFSLPYVIMKILSWTIHDRHFLGESAIDFFFVKLMM
jgi:hypothetical protein